ncbi:uncharacterized protein [Phaseolus vulgaris]|uniref:uncharacterized protein n=1 Tax=Phaseolus vulgaris TaxID=3885 RepID=UPI0035CC2572
MNDACIEPSEVLHRIPVQNDVHSMHMGTSLTSADNTMVSQTLIETADLFSWIASDIPEVSPDIITHRLSMNKETQFIAQKKRKMGEEKHNALRNEIDKLVKVDFIIKPQYTTWRENVVMVKKPNGKWKMCTDNTDCNKAFPKDPYPFRASIA